MITSHRSKVKVAFDIVVHVAKLPDDSFAASDHGTGMIVVGSTEAAALEGMASKLQRHWEWVVDAAHVREVPPPRSAAEVES